RCTGPHRVASSGWSGGSVRLHAFTFASSHFHLLVWARGAALASFQQPAPELQPPHHRVARPRGRSGRSGSSGSGTPGWRPPPATGPLSFLYSYFVFYVIQHYIDGSYRFSGLWSFVQYLLHKKP
ncbi:MAG TPA: hypothetical protein VEU50_46315, partial [Archangium sp.]|nr:hypothetical protein [Archangium sp.]